VTAASRQTVFERTLPLLGIAAALVVWWLASIILWNQSPLLQSFGPGETGAALVQLIQSGEIWPHVIASLRRVLIGLVLAAGIGIPLGILFGVWPRIERSASVLLQLIRMISPLSWMPLAVMAFGVGDQPVIFLLSVAAVWPLLLNTAAGVAGVDAPMLLLAKSLCANRFETVVQVILPSIFSHLITGLRLAVGIAWIVLVPAEMLGVRAGLGYYILDARDRLSYSELMAVIIIIGAIGYGLDTVLRMAQRAFSAED
jgi:NitT/TauT family transport system permease protein